VRKSTDSNTANLGPIIDESAWLRSVQRRKIVEEIISSEESYIGDLKILINVSSANYPLLLPVAEPMRLTGLLHNSQLCSRIINSNSIIHSSEHFPNPTSASGSSCRTAPSRT
jgi:hypothetical protein